MIRVSLILAVQIILAFLGVKTLRIPVEAVVFSKLEVQMPGSSPMSRLDTFYVRNEYILEPLKENYSKSLTDLKTGVETITDSKTYLKWHSLCNFQEKNGLRFTVDKQSPSPKIEPYGFANNEKKIGTSFISEPFLVNGISVNDYSKDKDTIINGQQCFVVKRNKVVPIIYKGKVIDKFVDFRIAINPSMKFYKFPFISEKIIDHFGGGGIMYVEGRTESGMLNKIVYLYRDFTPAETKLFDHYQALYNTNKDLFDNKGK